MASFIKIINDAALLVNMNIKITRLDNSLPLPEYKTPGSVAFDFYARLQTTLKPGEQRKIPSNLIIKTPPGYMLMLSARSSITKKQGLILPNGVGIIDQDYSGPEDEIHIPILNVGQAVHTIEKGERIAQGMFIKIERALWEEGPAVGASRGGFGSTGAL